MIASTLLSMAVALLIGGPADNSPAPVKDREHQMESIELVFTYADEACGTSAEVYLVDACNASCKHTLLFLRPEQFAQNENGYNVNLEREILTTYLNKGFEYISFQGEYKEQECTNRRSYTLAQRRQYFDLEQE